jgi:hypothetical protein
MVDPILLALGVFILFTGGWIWRRWSVRSDTR